MMKPILLLTLCGLIICQSTCLGAAAQSQDSQKNPKKAGEPASFQKLADPPPPPPVPASTPPAIDMIYDALLEVFPSVSQLFTMEFPGRVLDQSSFFYNASNSNSQYLKPQSVIENEAILGDTLIPVAQIVLGPDGRTLSSQYEAALSSFVPKYSTEAFRKDQEKIRSWLLSPMMINEVNGGDTLDKFITSENAPKIQKDQHTTLMDFHEFLFNKYESYRLQWRLNKTAGLEQAIDGTFKEQDDYFRYIAQLSLEKDEEIQGLWQDLVVRGYHHRVLEAFSYLDVTSAGEILEQSKQDMRIVEEARIEGGAPIYPVQFTPADWANSLTTDFTLQDLTMDPQSLQLQVMEKQSQVNTLAAQIGILQDDKVGDVTELERSVALAHADLESAQSAVVDAYGSAVMTAAKIYLDETYGTDAQNQNLNAEEKKQLEGAIGKETGAKKPISDADVQAIFDGWKKTGAAQSKLTNAIQQLSTTEAALAAAHTSDFKKSIALLQAQLTTAQTSLKNLQLQLRLYDSMDPKSTVTQARYNNSKMTPSFSTPGPWETVEVSIAKATSVSKSTLASASSASSWGLDLWFASGGGSSSSSSSSSSQKFDSTNSKVDVAFQATKVTIDRTAWFNPGVMTSSANLFKLNGETISSGPVKPSSGTSGKNLRWNPSDLKPSQNDLLAAYPTSFIIVRDVTIKITASESIQDSSKSYLHSQSASSGGFLCFSYSTSKSSTSQSSFSFASTDDKTVVIKIPGPQILAWGQTWVPADKSTPYADQALPNGYFPPIPSGMPPPSPPQPPPPTVPAIPAECASEADPSGPIPLVVTSAYVLEMSNDPDIMNVPMGYSWIALQRSNLATVMAGTAAIPHGATILVLAHGNDNIIGNSDPNSPVAFNPLEFLFAIHHNMVPNASPSAIYIDACNDGEINTYIASVVRTAEQNGQFSGTWVYGHDSAVCGAPQPAGPIAWHGVRIR